MLLVTPLRAIGNRCGSKGILYPVSQLFLWGARDLREGTWMTGGLPDESMTLYQVTVVEGFF